MPSAGGEDGDVAGRDLDFLPAVAAEPPPGMAAGDAKRLVHRRVVVQIIEHAVAPHLAPAIGAEQSLDGFLRVAVVDIDSALVDHEGQGIIGHQAVVFKQEGERFNVADNRHSNSPAENYADSTAAAGSRSLRISKI